MLSEASILLVVYLVTNQVARRRIPSMQSYVFEAVYTGLCCCSALCYINIVINGPRLSERMRDLETRGLSATTLGS